ncbi:archaemetzincin-2 isoform X2 [Suricata suricatta]|uniref:archaemetzincin-2 isoform X2 n=1 Tax=Suricata suricatta TaxID=37032 RepID=UPI0011559F26|nr:archaemetzincin-2 isoform X2 [Suricata suricatta]
MRVLVDAREKLHIPWGDNSNQVNGDKMMAFDTRSSMAAQGMVETRVFLQYLPVIRALWADSGIQNAYDRRREFQLGESVKYFLDNLDKLGEAMETVRHSEHTLKTALISENPALVSQYKKLDAGERRLLNEAFKPDHDLFEPITLHSPSDWIISHPEAPQDFEQFFSDPYRKAPSPEKHSIYIQCIGSLGNSRIISDEYIKWLKGYCEAFFYGLTVKLLEPVPVSATRCSFRVNENTQNLQIHAGHILKFLKKKKPADAFCIVGITMIDLYPRDSWNFVFGQASLTDGVGIFSFARYGSDFYRSHDEGKVNKPQKVSPSDYAVFDNYYTPPVTSVLLLRSCKVDIVCLKLSTNTEFKWIP